MNPTEPDPITGQTTDSVPGRPRRRRSDPDDAWNLVPIPPSALLPIRLARRPEPRLVVVDNVGDELAATCHINALGVPPDGRVVIRPTPGTSDVATLGLDLLVAIGKHPGAAKDERVIGRQWRIGMAWLGGSGATDVIVDRAHLLGEDQAAAIAEAAARLGMILWLLWAEAANPFHSPALARARGHFPGRTETIDLWEFHQRLPVPPRPPLATGPRPSAVGNATATSALAPGNHRWPALPAADFTTFSAACRQRQHFARARGEQVPPRPFGTPGPTPSRPTQTGPSRTPRRTDNNSACNMQAACRFVKLRHADGHGGR
jgi:hypothetical protein